ncbi:MAG: hypothetical protein FJ034_00385 [Chloroflexi bacterium]|nr:hypothetical protein [Chloroflexota bacterium]
MPYAVYVDELDFVWATEWGSGALLRFDPATETFESFPLPANANVRQLLGRPGEVWGGRERPGSARRRPVLVRGRLRPFDTG